MQALNDAIKIFGTKAKMAKALGVNPMTVTQWQNRAVPVVRAIEIERATGGEISRNMLRPDIFGDAA